MKSCKTQIYNLENQCAKIIEAIEKLLMPNLQQEQFVRVLTNTARNLDHGVTELHTLSKDLRNHRLTEASTMLSAVKNDFSHYSKTIWKEYVEPITSKGLELTGEMIAKVKVFLSELLKTLKADMKNLLGADRSLHAENPHSKNFIRPQIVHKKYEGKKKDEAGKAKVAAAS